jgi:hypothetical protein
VKERRGERKAINRREGSQIEVLIELNVWRKNNVVVK